jgi:predicted glycosyltransferase
MKSEILSALEWLARYNPHCVKILGLRDIIDEPDTVKESWKNNGVYEALDNLYDLILIYGMAEVYNSVENYQFSQSIREKTRYIGYIAEINNNKPDRQVELDEARKSDKFLLITIGGGEWMGNVIIGNYLDLLARNRSRINYDSLILTGPFIPEKLWTDYYERSGSLPTNIMRFVPETRPYIESSDLVLATGGYNTITDLLSYGGKALIVPRIQYRQEQLMRAMRLGDMGLIRFIHPDTVNPDSLFENIRIALEDDNKPLAEARRKKSIDLNGTKNLANIFGKLISGKI